VDFEEPQDGVDFQVNMFDDAFYKVVLLDTVNFP